MGHLACCESGCFRQPPLQRGWLLNGSQPGESIRKKRKEKRRGEEAESDDTWMITVRIRLEGAKGGGWGGWLAQQFVVPVRGNICPLQPVPSVRGVKQRYALSSLPNTKSSSLFKSEQ